MKIHYLLFAFALIAFGCDQNDEERIKSLMAEIDSLRSLNTEKDPGSITTFLTFQENNAEEAMNFYVSLFDNSEVLEVQRYGKEGPAPEGSIFVARFVLDGSQFACSDSYIKHEWGFTPGVSVWADCKSDEEIENLFEKLSEEGNVLMPLNNYGFSQKFAWIEDRFGVSWQINFQ